MLDAFDTLRLFVDQIMKYDGGFIIAPLWQSYRLSSTYCTV